MTRDRNLCKCSTIRAPEQAPQPQADRTTSVRVSSSLRVLRNIVSRAEGHHKPTETPCPATERTLKNVMDPSWGSRIKGEKTGRRPVLHRLGGAWVSRGAPPV